MSCSSPFVYVESAVGTEQNFSVGTSGSYTLPSYSYKWGGECTTWKEGCSVCKWWNGCKWTTCTWKICEAGPWTVELWPSITFNASCTIPMVTESEVGIQMTVDSPAEPYELSSLTLDACNCNLNIDGTGVTINLIDTPISVEEENGEFSISVDLLGWSASTDDSGLKYNLDITSSLEFCLDPVPPVGWINLVLSCTLSVDDESIDYSYSTSFEISCPIVSVEEAGA
jgi:hypothetical protein